jgi:hypothetical protein
MGNALFIAGPSSSLPPFAGGLDGMICLHYFGARCMNTTTPTAATKAIPVSISIRRFRVKSAVRSGSLSLRYPLVRTNRAKAIECTELTRKAAQAAGWRSRMRAPARRKKATSTGRTTTKYNAIITTRTASPGLMVGGRMSWQRPDSLSGPAGVP